jgi:hypothetical protein
MARTVVLAGSLVFICLLAYLTIQVAVDDGVTPLVVVSLAILALLGLGVLGALTTRPPDG